jgi:hypothetical protein
MEDNANLSFENKNNLNFFKFNVREYFSNNMNPFEILRNISLIIFSKPSNQMKFKFANFFFLILKKIIKYNTKENLNYIKMITTDVLRNLLTRKEDYIIILKYIFFLFDIGEFEFCQKELQKYIHDSKYIKYGELIYYKGMVEHLLDNNSTNFISSFETCFGIIKHDEVNYYEFIINFFLNNNFTVNVNELFD